MGIEKKQIFSNNTNVNIIDDPDIENIELGDTFNRLMNDMFIRYDNINKYVLNFVESKTSIIRLFNNVYNKFTNKKLINYRLNSSTLYTLSRNIISTMRGISNYDSSYTLKDIGNNIDNIVVNGTNYTQYNKIIIRCLVNMTDNENNWQTQGIVNTTKQLEFLRNQISENLKICEESLILEIFKELNGFKTDSAYNLIVNVINGKLININNETYDYTQYSCNATDNFIKASVAINNYIDSIITKYYDNGKVKNLSNIETVQNVINKLNSEVSLKLAIMNTAISNVETSIVETYNVSISDVKDYSDISLDIINSIHLNNSYRDTKTSIDFNITDTFSKISAWFNGLNGDNTLSWIKEKGNNIYDTGEKFVCNITSKIVEIVNNPNSIKNIAKETINDVVDSVGTVITNVESLVGGAVDNAANFANTVGDLISSSMSNYDGSSQTAGTMSKAIGALSAGLKTYVDGVSETGVFGPTMEKSWHTESNSFLETFLNNKSTYKVNFTSKTPLDPGDKGENLWGSMLVGTPPSFTSRTDPNNRVYAASFIKDAKFLSLTPGLPKYSGGAYDTYMGTSNMFNQTKDGTTQLQYLLKNGIDADFANKDKRYYTFNPNYTEYFSYLETMLNTVRIKMGLATEGSNTYSIYNFINPKTQKIYNKYNNSLGFFINPTGISSEMIDSSQSTFGQEQAQRVNSTAAEHARTNYLTGMGTGSGWHNAARIATNTVSAVGALSSNTAEFFQYANKFSSAGTNTIAKLALFATGAVLDAARYPASNDASALIQQFATQNGMKVVYPELWDDSNYGKSVNVNFEFVSPYGDPESIFQHVMVPFFALMCFAMPRQADYNGLVSPFFVRADVPGVVSVDLGLITNFTFTRGGNNDMWSKDGLPLSISGSLTITDLYPYLAMTKRLSFMSANPNYTSFLNSFAGLHVVDNGANDSLNTYFKQMLNRVSGLNNMPISNTLWNTYDRDSQESHKQSRKSNRTDNINKINTKSLVFMRK